MFVTDQNLRMRFQRQPRVLGTQCFYVPSTTLLQNEGLAYGQQVRIVSHPQNDNDLFVGVVPSDALRRYYIGDRFSAEWVAANIDPEAIKLVLWKDLAQ